VPLLFRSRLLRVGIEIDGEVRVYDERLDIRVSGTKMASAAQNECEVTISNLSRDVRNYLLTETSPFTRSGQPRILTIDAGRQSTGAFRLFVGDITEASPTQPPDITLTIKAKTKQAAKSAVVAVSKGPTERLSVIARGVADALGLQLVFEAADRQVANYSFSGGARKQVDKLGDAGRVNAYVDDERLIIKDYGAALAATTYELSARSGLVGIPELTEQGVKVRFLLDPRAQLGGRLTLRSEIYPAVDGQYAIYSLAYELASRDTPWYGIAECMRL
jgi:hypothetical protein